MASRRTNPRLPRALHNPARDVFKTDRICPRCEYNLRGLSPGMKCPECGALIVTAAGASAHDENLAAAPAPYLTLLASGLVMMAVASVAGVVLLLQRRPQSINWVVVVGAMAAGLWWIGTLVVTRHKPHAVVRSESPRVEQRHARWAARLTQLGWGLLPVGLGLSAELDRQAIAAAAAIGGVYQRPEASTMLASAAWIGAGVAAAGLVVVCYLLADLAQWASDSPLADRFRLAGLGLPLGGGAAILGWGFYDRLGPITLLGLAAAVIGSVAVVLSAGALVLGLLQLANLSVWAVHNHTHYDQMMEKRQARERRHEAEMVERLDPTPNRPDHTPDAIEGVSPGPSAAPQGSPLTIPSSEHVIPRAPTTSPYEIDAGNGVP